MILNLLDANMDGKIEGNAFLMFMIDSKTGIVYGLRSMGIGEDFMKELNRICRKDSRYTTAQYQEWLQNDLFKKPLPQLWLESEKTDWDK